MDAATAAIISSALTMMGNWIMNRQKNVNDTKQAIAKRQWDKEDAERKLQIERIEKEFAVYNEVLKADGKVQYVTIDEQSRLNDFEIKKFNDEVRPILFRNLNLLNEGVRKLVRSLDECAASIDHYGRYEEWLNELSKHYTELISEIERQFDRVD